MLPRDPTAVTDSWSTDLVLVYTVPDPSNLGETARRASVHLDAISTSPTPSVAGALSVTQQFLLSTALMLILAITQDRLVDATAQTDPFPPPPVLVDVTVRPDATCLVCYARLVNTALVQCWHLVLCAVSIG